MMKIGICSPMDTLVIINLYNKSDVVNFYSSIIVIPNAITFLQDHANNAAHSDQYAYYKV